MKKIMFITLLFSGVMLLTAQDTESVPDKPAGFQTPTITQKATDEWDILQLGFWFGNPKVQDKIGVSGFRIGAPFCGGKTPVYGLEGALLGAGTDEVYGVQFGLCTAMADKVSGLQAAFYTEAREVNGVQLGIVNVAKDKTFQIGLVNFVDGGFLPWCILFNFKL